MRKKHKFIYTRTILLLIVPLLFSFNSRAQEQWSLEQCVQHALENNITIKQQALTVDYRENQKTQSKFDLIPSLNAGASQSFGFGRSIGIDNTYVDNNSSTASFYLSSEVTLFNGLAKQNTIKQRNFEWQAALQDLEKAKDDVSLNVVSAYLDILFNKELLNTAKEQLAITQQQIDYNQKMVEAGSLAKGKLLETESQAANEELTVTNYENQLKISLLNLQQLLEVEVSDSFDIVIPQFDVATLDKNLLNSSDVFNTAVQQRPEILSKELSLKSIERENAIAKAQLYPSLTFGASYYNNYYKVSSFNNQSFSDQIKNNGSKQLQASLRIPIFNGLTARTNLANSRINYESANNELQLEKNNLLKQIQQVHANALAAMKKYYASQKAVQSTTEAFRYVEEKFSLGIVTPLEYNDAKNKVTSAQSSYIQAKYEYIFRIKILDFYAGKEITL